MTEISSFGGSFAGIGVMVLLFVLAYVAYLYARWIKPLIDLDTKYDLMEEMTLDKYAKKKGFDLEKEAIRRDIFRKENKSFRRQLRKQVYEEMFGKNKEDKE